MRRYLPPLRDRPFDVLGLVIEHFVRADATFPFLQIGAFDGESGDPIHASVVKFGLHGVLIEPNPHPYQKLLQTYAGHKGLVFENSAVGWNDGSAPLYRFKADSPLPGWTQQVSSFSIEHLHSEVRGIPDAAKYIEAVPVPVVSRT